MTSMTCRSERTGRTRTGTIVGVALLAGLTLGLGWPMSDFGSGLLNSASAASASAPRIGGNAAGLPWWVTRYRAAIPQATYSTIVISPRPTRGVELGDSVQFVIRAEDARGRVEDFAFHVPAGETISISIASDGGAGWTPRGEAILYAPDNGVFAAWGVTANGLVRFEPVERDAQEAAEERERERDLEQFRRERMRTE